MDFNFSSKWQAGEYRRVSELLTVMQFMAACRHSHVAFQTSNTGLYIKVFTDTEEESEQACDFVRQFLCPQWVYNHQALTSEVGDFCVDTFSYEFQEWGE